MGVETTTISSTGAKKGVKKQRFELIPPRALMELTKLYGRGAKKYAPNNFRLGYETSKSFGAGQRHAVLFWAKENYDTETECHHIGSFVWHCFTILESNVTHPHFDDRPYGANHLADGLDHSNDEVPLLSIAPTPKEIPTGFRHDLIPVYPFALVAEVFGYDTKLAVIADDATYGTYYGLMQDHANRYWAGEDLDTVSGLPHLAWAAAYGLLLIELSLAKPTADDRFLPAAHVGYDSVPVPAAVVEPDAVIIFENEGSQFDEAAPVSEAVSALSDEVFLAGRAGAVPALVGATA